MCSRRGAAGRDGKGLKALLLLVCCAIVRGLLRRYLCSALSANSTSHPKPSMSKLAHRAGMTRRVAHALALADAARIRLANRGRTIRSRTAPDRASETPCGTANSSNPRNAPAAANRSRRAVWMPTTIVGTNIRWMWSGFAVHAMPLNIVAKSHRVQYIIPKLLAAAWKADTLKCQARYVPNCAASLVANQRRGHDAGIAGVAPGPQLYT